MNVQREIRFGIWAFAGLLILAVANANGEGFEYLNCANRAVGLPLTKCATMTLNEQLTDLHIGDVFDLGMKIPADPEFDILPSSLLPLVIPKANYSKRNSWTKGTRKYLKVARNRVLFPLKDEGDVIAIISDIDQMKPQESSDKPDDLFVLMHTKTTFLYSQSKGVLAISMPDDGESISVYLCASHTCLFGHEPR